MTCDELFERLTDLLDGELDAAIEAEALDHLASCERCEQVLAETRTITALAADERPVQLGSESRAQILDRIEAEIRADQA